MPDFRPTLRRLKAATVFAFTLLPIAAFYVVLFKNAVRIPILDDYDIVLHTVTWLSQHPSFSARLGYILNAEHNGYKLIFDNTVVFAQYLLLGQVHLLPLVILGNLLALFIFFVVLRMARVVTADPVDKWVLLTPVAWLIFQLQYASALDFSSCSLQNLGVVFFALLSLYLLDKPTNVTFITACLTLALAITCSPSGFFTAPVGFLLLVQHRRWKQVVPWVLTASAMLLLYLYHYTAPPPVAGAAATSGGFAHLSVIYALSFMGSSAARFSSIAPALVLGVLLCGVVLFAIKLKYSRSNPPVFYAMLLIMVNALAVSGLRSDLGLAQSLASRYRIYSNLFLVFTYIFFIEAIRPTVQRRAVRNACFGIALTISIAFCCLSDFAGARFLQGKKQALTFSYRTQWQGRSPAQDSASTELLANPALHRQILDGIYDIERPALEEAIRADVYTPPQNP